MSMVTYVCILTSKVLLALLSWWRSIREHGKVDSWKDQELRDKGLRPDFIAYLESVVNYRNDMAHEFILNNAITQSMANFSERKLYGDLFRAIYELEQIIILYDWCEEHNGWK